MSNLISRAEEVNDKSADGWKDIYCEMDYHNGVIDFVCPKCGELHEVEHGEYGWQYGDPIPWKYCPICGWHKSERS